MEKVIYTFFLVEMLCKWMAMGLFGKLAYFGDAWNRLDCFIVAAGYEVEFDAFNVLILKCAFLLRMTVPVIESRVEYRLQGTSSVPVWGPVSRKFQ